MNNDILVPTEEMFDEMLDNQFEVVDVAGKLYSVSEALKNLDPERYQEMFEEYCDDYVREQINERELAGEQVATVSSKTSDKYGKLYYPISFMAEDMTQAIAGYENNCDAALTFVSF